MQPHADKKKMPSQPASDKSPADTRAPMSVKGQKYVSPEGRHSQQTHRLAEEQTAAEGLTTEKEHHAHARAAVVTEIADRAAAKVQHQERSKPK